MVDMMMACEEESLFGSRVVVGCSHCLAPGRKNVIGLLMRIAQLQEWERREVKTSSAIAAAVDVEHHRLLP